VKAIDSLIQYFLLVLVVIFYTINGFVVAALFGSLLSVSNTLIYHWYIKKQQALVDADAQKSFRMAINSTLIRLIFLILIVLIGLGLMGLDPAALCVSLVVGQVGFIFDRLRQK